ncbi:uncharacterized protein DFL_005146 [Arthrobotrys flagrans]|uniref:Uncharacterized protein n=1 Tax=Arthrobotrys flagrans TaxID=97331 RepID=A0A437A6V8_ARTFL|nr:hypothetical protein DFL_005146 [Arthrobotrys flagrans]
MGKEGEEIDGILKIIKDSIKSLTFMKECIDEMKIFFASVLSDVKTSMCSPLDTFLEGVNTAIVRSGNAQNAREINNLEFTNINKRRLAEQALRLHGKIYMISNIAEIYIGVSTEYIRPALNMMERLLTADSSQYQRESSKFEKWCKESIQKIDLLSIEEAKKKKKAKTRPLALLRYWHWVWGRFAGYALCRALQLFTTG